MPLARELLRLAQRLRLGVLARELREALLLEDAQAVLLLVVGDHLAPEARQLGGEHARARLAPRRRHLAGQCAASTSGSNHSLMRFSAPLSRSPPRRPRGRCRHESREILRVGEGDDELGFEFLCCLLLLHVVDEGARLSSSDPPLPPNSFLLVQNRQRRRGTSESPARRCSARATESRVFLEAK